MSTKRLVQLPNGEFVVANELGQRVYKTFMVVSASFRCDKGCPCCTAQITTWPKGEDCWERMDDCLARCEQAGITFEYVTMSGNGEPSMYPADVLRGLKETFDRYDHLFEYRRFQTGGNILWEPEVWNIFGPTYVFETTRMSLDDAEDMEILRYRRNYTESPLFPRSRVVFNHTLLRRNEHRLLADIEGYVRRFSNVLAAVNLKILNPNTFDPNDLSSRQSQWILKHGLGKNDGQRIVELMDAHFPRVNDYNPFYDRYEWLHPSGIKITLYARLASYGLPNIVFYQGKLVDYGLKPQRLELPEGTDILALWRAAGEQSHVRA
ncbi:hypothetical protein A2304_02420 [Candidatus Uhrbacteria bacterium RIFOXYB2_FULL_57_15]|uniref:Radical SAM core domain-containing protein n=1 Tax=Candidatus Uhrbacteria bacterium RIFOXYB2_FULL_57_15 TaxID=1802422 RepID=A0A1F7W9G3_9BACT|nr:MAG: hypothetical protein A2304_02420 [Candidatus Uhrbacteria bacterium RIFOXYB2_FULL_57_15]